MVGSTPSSQGSGSVVGSGGGDFCYNLRRNPDGKSRGIQTKHYGHHEREDLERRAPSGVKRLRTHVYKILSHRSLTTAEVEGIRRARDPPRPC